MWYSMNGRCYNTSHERYKSHGGRGVTVVEGWKDLNRFIKDVDKIKGYNKAKILSGDLVLDKDGEAGEDHKVYSLKTCAFVSKTESNTRKPSQQEDFSAVSPTGKEYPNISNQRAFAKVHKLNQSDISKVLSGEKESYKGWVFTLDKKK